LFRREPRLLAAIVARCCQIKANIVGQDETEGGLRAILNFGHTIGHAIEAISGYGKYLHGEAISIGQIAAARLSAERTGLPMKDVARITELFRGAGLPAQVKLNASQRTKLFAAMKLDKKVSNGEIKFVLANRIGKVVWGQKVPLVAIQKALTTDERR
jgi:3-dehydroquinate synthetase